MTIIILMCIFGWGYAFSAYRDEKKKTDELREQLKLQGEFSQNCVDKLHREFIGILKKFGLIEDDIDEILRRIENAKD